MRITSDYGYKIVVHKNFIHSTAYSTERAVLAPPPLYTLVVNWLQFVSFGISGFSQFSVNRDVTAPIKVCWGPIGWVTNRKE